MEHTEINETSNMLHKIKAIEKELMDLKLSILNKYSPSKKRTISLKGILKGVDITDQDITDAKKSLYSNIEI